MNLESIALASGVVSLIVLILSAIEKILKIKSRWSSDKLKVLPHVKIHPGCNRNDGEWLGVQDGVLNTFAKYNVTNDGVGIAKNILVSLERLPIIHFDEIGAGSDKCAIINYSMTNIEKVTELFLKRNQILSLEIQYEDIDGRKIGPFYEQLGLTSDAIYTFLNVSNK